MRTRPLSIATNRLGNLSEIIQQTINSKGYAHVLEVGCGEGVPMHELQLQFKNKLKIVGINRFTEDGNSNMALKTGLKNKQFSMASYIKLKWLQQQKPVYVACDAALPLPFNNNTFDLVYSSQAIEFIADKMHFFEEINRILQPTGIARLHLVIEYEKDRNKNPTWNFAPVPLYNISDKQGTPIVFNAFINQFPSLKLLNSPITNEFYLEMLKAPTLNFGLKLYKTVLLKTFLPIKGEQVQCFYTKE